VTELVRAAGGLVTRETGEGVQVLLVHRPRYDDWSFPKGKLDAGESDEEAAVREVEEETGYRCRLLDEVGRRRYRDRHGRPKEVRYWRMNVIDEMPFTPNREVDERRWVTPHDAAALLSYDDDRQILATLDGAP
jgi:8-oxo-dGTP pyrophosphatase MutT (NUDIX family)